MAEGEKVTDFLREAGLISSDPNNPFEFVTEDTSIDEEPPKSSRARKKVSTEQKLIPPAKEDEPVTPMASVRPEDLTDGQKEAVNKLYRWYTNFNPHVKPYFSLSGAAGTGKTTVIRYFIEGMGLDLKDIICCAYVGKAVSILQMNGLPAKTIHSLIYNRIVVKKKSEDLTDLDLDPDNLYTSRFVLKKRLDADYKLIVCDEASMIAPKMDEELRSFGIPIVYIGDHNQLPPIMSNHCDVMDHPDHILTQIMRQKEDDPIIRLSQMAIHGIRYPYGDYGKSKVVYQINEGTNLLSDYDMIIVGKNDHRSYLINHIRHDILGFEDIMPHPGEKMICRQNNWSRPIGKDMYLTNGTTGIVGDVHYHRANARSLSLDFTPDVTGYTLVNLPIDMRYLRASYAERKMLKESMISKYNLFEYGYAITAYMSQGSQANRVLFYDEPFRDLETTKRLRYTAITRAREAITIVV